MNMNVHQSLVAAWIGSEDLHQASSLFWKTEQLNLVERIMDSKQILLLYWEWDLKTVP